jgi:hypothetical protein
MVTSVIDWDTGLNSEQGDANAALAERRPPVEVPRSAISIERRI